MDDTKNTPPSSPDKNKRKIPPTPEVVKNTSSKSEQGKPSRNKTRTAYEEDNSAIQLDPTSLYLNEIGHKPLLSANEEVRLAREIAQGDDNSKKQMIESNLRLVVTLAKRSLNRGLSFLDLIEEGNLGLIRAVEKFNPELGFRFSTYATWWIKQSIDRAIMNNGKTIRMPIHLIKEINSCTRKLRLLTEQLGREPSDEELAASLGKSVQHIARLRKKEIKVCSADTPLPQDNDKSLLDIFPDNENADPGKILEQEDLRKKLECWIERLNERESEIVARRFGLQGYESSTLDEVGAEVGLTRERVRQIQIEALARLRHFMEREGLSMEHFPDES